MNAVQDPRAFHVAASLTPGARLWVETRGAVATEYAIVVGVSALVICAALVALGPPLLASYSDSRNVLIAPVP